MKDFYNYRMMPEESGEGIEETIPITYEEDVFTLIHQGKLIEVYNAIKNKSIDPNHRNDKGQSLLYYAILYKQIDIAKELVKSGASLDTADNKGTTVKDIISYYHPEIKVQDLLAFSDKITSTKENLVENEQYENQDSGLLGCIKNHCEIF